MYKRASYTLVYRDCKGPLRLDGGDFKNLDLLRGTIVNRTDGIHKNLYIAPFLLLITMFGPVNYGPP